MLKKFLQSGFLVMVLALTLANLAAGVAVAQKASEASMNEDDLDTVNGLPWGAKGWPFSKVTDVKDSLVGTVLGRVVIDRHGVDPSRLIRNDNLVGAVLGRLIRAPFSGPMPDRIVYISLWGSNSRGCFAELITHYATVYGENDEADTQAIVPKQLELGVNGQIVELSPQSGTAEKRFSQNYTYTTYENGTELEHSGTWYMARNLFRIDSSIASILSSAPPKEVRARITLTNDESIVLPIGEKTVKRWKDAYSFNPHCKSVDQVQPTSRQTQP